MSLGWPHRELERAYSNMRRLERAVDVQEGLAGLQAAALAHEALADVMRVLIERERQKGATWREIGMALGRSPRAVARVFQGKPRQAKAGRA